MCCHVILKLMQKILFIVIMMIGHTVYAQSYHYTTANAHSHND